MFVQSTMLGQAHHDDGDALRVELWAARATHHLQRIRYRIVHVALRLGIVVLRALSNPSECLVFNVHERYVESEIPL